jgi:hypothetical protein
MIVSLYQWIQEYKPIHDLIVQASSTDCDDGWRDWPIGMSWQYIHVYTQGESLQIGNHTNLVLCAISSTTDSTRRPNGINRSTIIQTLEKNNIINNTLDYTTYFQSLPSYKFVISPEGNGIDCHRHYEALLAGCIPIIERNPLTEKKYAGCPILWTTDYSEITPSYLQQKYDEMLHKEYDFSRLFLPFYDKATQELIKQSGNFWLQQIDHTRCTWY